MDTDNTDYNKIRINNRTELLKSSLKTFFCNKKLLTDDIKIKSCSTEQKVLFEKKLIAEPKCRALSDDLLSIEQKYSLDEGNIDLTVKPMKLYQILEIQMTKQDSTRLIADNSNAKKINETYKDRNRDAPTVNVVSDISTIIELSDSSNSDSEDRYDHFKYTPQSPTVLFDKTTLISICEKITALKVHLDCFDVINSLILKRALKNQSSVGFASETLLDRDNYYYLKTVRGALIHKALGEEMDERVLEFMMNICQDIDELLHPILECLFNYNESFNYEEWSDIFIENHSDKKKENYELLYVIDAFGNKISPQNKMTRQPRLETVDLKKINKDNWTHSEPINWRSKDPRICREDNLNEI